MTNPTRLGRALRHILRQTLPTLALCAIALLAANAWHTRHLPAGQAPEIGRAHV